MERLRLRERETRRRFLVSGGIGEFHKMLCCACIDTRYETIRLPLGQLGAYVLCFVAMLAWVLLALFRSMCVHVLVCFLSLCVRACVRVCVCSFLRTSTGTCLS